jgi:hypothetical protein
METEFAEVPFLPLSASLENSRLMGNYYRNLATNYDDYTRGVAPWPYRPDLIG